ncbi:MAG: hypothetical protein M3Q10_11415 [Chloroflexota bacterium]|nr:hypothetical protein [Chloroflexota bacterium]
MTGSSLRRLDRLADRLRPAGCRQPGPSCTTAWHVVGAEDPARNPPPPPVCPACGRPRPVRVLELAGVDATRL